MKPPLHWLTVVLAWPSMVPDEGTTNAICTRCRSACAVHLYGDEKARVILDLGGPIAVLCQHCHEEFAVWLSTRDGPFTPLEPE